MPINPMWKQYLSETLLKGIIRAPSRLNLPPETLRQTLDRLSHLLPKTEGATVRSFSLAGLAAEEIKPGHPATQLILHLHGGAFFLGSLRTHRAWTIDMALRTQMQIVHLDYPLAPESPYPDGLDALYLAYLTLLDQGIQAKDIILSGDSSGANLAVSLCLRLRDQQQPLPAALMLQSPFLDLTLSSPSLRYNAQHDALLSQELLEAGIDYYLVRGVDPAEPYVSPLFADLRDLPLTLIQVGSKEILLDDAQRFRDQAEAAGVDVTFKLYTGMWHDFQLFNAWFSEGKQALADLAEFAHRIDQN